MNRTELKTWIEENLDWYEMSHDYSEPGYSLDEGKDLIFFADWNQVKDEEIMDQIEENFMVEWSDEWYQCCDCNKSIRTSPDCYQWQPYYHLFNECEPVCFDCISDNAGLQETLIEDYVIKGNEIDPEKDSVNFRLLQIDNFDLEKHCFEVMNNHHYENGFYHGQNDNPVKIFKNMNQSFLESNHFIFKQSKQSQFYIKFDLYFRPIDSE